MKRLLRFLLPAGVLGRRAVVVVLGDAVLLGAVTVLSMLLARVLRQEEMGTFRQVTYLGTMVLSLCELGISGSIYRYWNTLEGPVRRIYLRMVLISVLTLCTLGSIFLAIAAPWIAREYGNPELHTALLIAAAYPLAFGPLMIFRPILINQGRAAWAIMMDVGFTLASMAALLIPTYSGWPFESSIALWMVVSLARLTSLSLVIPELGGFRGSWWNGEVFREVWPYIWPLQIARIPGFVTEYFDKVAMSIYLAPDRFALYSLGAREIPFVGNIGWSISAILLPSLVEDANHGHINEFSRKMRRAAEQTAIFTYVIGAFCVWNAVPVMRFFFSTAYTESAIPFRIFALFTFLRVIQYGSLPKALGKTNIIMYSTFITMAGTVGLSFVLVPLFGMMGMAMSVLTGTIASAAYTLWRCAAILNRSVLSFFPLRRLLVIAAAAFAGVLGASYIMRLLGFAPVETLTGFFDLVRGMGVELLLASVIYLALLMALRIVKFGSKEEPAAAAALAQSGNTTGAG